MENIIGYFFIVCGILVASMFLIALFIPLFDPLIHRYQRAIVKKDVKHLIPQINQALREFDTLFRPTIRVGIAEQLAFQHKYKNLKEGLTELILQEKYKEYNEFLDFFKVYDALRAFDDFEFLNRRKKNNELYDAIQNYKKQVVELRNNVVSIHSKSHYFSFSELEIINATIAKLESITKKVGAKYSFYLREGAEEVIQIKQNIEYSRDKHNKEFIERELKENKTYFDTVLGEYPLDPQQRDAIVKLEDNCLVIASAGSGKTSTILGKAKYLVEKRNIAPSKILLITYTRKAANELHERMKIEGMTCCTFHKLAKDIIANVTGQAPSFCEQDVTLNIFHKLIQTNGNFLHAVNDYLINQQSLMGLEHDYTDAFSYYEDRKKYGIQALFSDMDGNIIFTRSEEEKRLVSILARLGVRFRYEAPYPYNTTTPERRQYKPDFTIYYHDNFGVEKVLYLEHFAIDASRNVPQWFGDGERGGWQNANRRYNEGIEWKWITHSLNRTDLIVTTSADFRDGTVESKLIEQLRRYGVPINERSDEELYGMMVNRNKKVEKSVYTLITSFITLMKANEKTIDGLLREVPQAELQDISASINLRNRTILRDIIKPFYEEYERTLSDKGEIDYTDAIIKASELCRKGLWRNYEYILVDEFQDISVDRYKFLQALRGNSANTKLFCVGDDWQSIFRFSGSDMSLVYEFEKYFGYTEQCKIETTYRFHQPLIDKSSAFIMRNKEQKEKTIKTPNNDTNKTYLNFVKCDGSDRESVLKKVKEIVQTIPKDQSILLLGRYNYDAMSVGFSGKIDMKDNRITVDIDGRNLPFLSVHSAKGLEADHVILVNCNQGAFPSIIEDDPILDFVLSKSESYPFAEERRLFYVAMTRARMRMYVLYDQKRPSSFISEFLLKIEVGSYLCPKCLEGKMVAIKDGETSNGDKFRSFVCSNNAGGCDFFETKYGDLTPPGILITEEMTAQDVEKLREERRRERKHHATVTIPPPSPPLPPIEEPRGNADELPF